MSTSRVDVGTPMKNLRGWTNTEVNFHGFANLPTTRDEFVESPEFSCFGHQWTLKLYPGGKADPHDDDVVFLDDDNDGDNDGYVAVELVNKSNESIEIQWGLSARDKEGKEVVYQEPYLNEFSVGSDDHGPSSGPSWYFVLEERRSKFLELLVDGSLVIEVRMKTLMSIDKSIIRFIPTNPINKNVLELFLDEETADVVFEVGGEQTEKGADKTVITITEFHAHRPILQKCAPTLYEMCGKPDEGGITTVSIKDVKPKIFKHMVYYAYGGKLSEDELNNNAKDIINACDKYGVVHLKLEAEAMYVKSTDITIDNMMDNLLYADSKNLALLKEAVMDFILENKRDIIGKVSFDNLPSSMMTDLLTAVARGEDAKDESSDDNNEEESTKYYTMRVGVLRKMLDERGLDVDGSREAMIALLKENLEM